MDLFNHLGRQTLRAVNTVVRHPVYRVQADLLKGRHIRQHRKSARRCDDNRNQATVLNEGQGRGQVVENNRDLTGHGVIECWTGATVGNVQNEGSGQALEELHLQVPDSASARAGITVTTRRLFERCDKLGVIAGRETRMHGDDIGSGRNVGDRREIRQDVIGNLWIDRRIGRRGRDRRHPERIAIRRCFCSLIRAHHAPTAGLILDNHRLPKMWRDTLRHHAGNDVGGPTRRKGYNQLDGPAWVGLRACKTRCKAQGQSHHKSACGRRQAERCQAKLRI